MPTVYLALGSNLGDRKKFIELAIQNLKDCGVKIVGISKIIETVPVDAPPQGNYLNAVLKCQTALSPEGLLDLTQYIEHKLGRVRKVINGPRVIDIDILLYDDIKLITRRLIIPHPRMFEREFVMSPLKDIGYAGYS